MVFGNNSETHRTGQGDRMNELTAAELLEQCTAWRRGDQDGFQKIVALAPEVLREQQRELAREFEVSEATVSRWANGLSRPHVVVQVAVVEHVRRRVARLAGATSKSRQRSEEAAS